jgi:N-acetylneuraminic acid mutarotase
MKSKRRNFLIESLETRTLLHSFTANINFQPDGAPVPPGYVADVGAGYAERGNGYTYGWQTPFPGAFDRNAPRVSQVLDTWSYLPRGNQWEMAVPNGTYSIRLVAGDPLAFNSVFRINVENTLVVNGTPSASSPWVTGRRWVEVNDGRLTITNAAGSRNNKLALLDVVAVHATPRVNIVADSTELDEETDNVGGFTLTRSGDLSHPLTVNLSVGGTASNGIDYQTLPSSITFPVGAAQVQLPVTVIDDADTDSPETISVSILASDLYGIGTGSGVIRINDNDGTTTPTSWRINFQPAGAPIPAGYVADTGLVFGNRGGGLSYGWDLDNSAHTRDRNAPNSPDQRYDTLNHMQNGGNRVWELGLPNGFYTVRVVAGDPSYINSVYRINVENVLIVNGTPTDTVRWIEGTAGVSVSDGRLTVTSATGASNNKIAFIEVNTATTPPPVVTLTTPDANAAEQDRDTGTFTITRTGATTTALNVNYTLSGTATNTADYDTLTGVATIPAGASSVNVIVRPVDDTLAEANETVVMSLTPTVNYTLGASTTGTITIVDNDTSGAPIVWSTKANSPIARHEAMGAVVGGKLYLLGGYVDLTFRPTNRVDVYNPTTNAWSQLADMPERLSHSGRTNDDRYIYLAGGYPATATAQTFATTNVWRYDTQTDTWSALKPLPQARGGGALMLLGRTLHFVTGSDASRNDRTEHWSLDLDNPSANWITRAPLPAPRNHVAGAALNGKLYILGGQTGQDAATVWKREVWEYDPASNSWLERAPLINQIRSHMASGTVVHQGRIIIIGGETTNFASLRNVEAFDPGSNTWASLTPLPAARSSAVAGSFGNSLIVTTGYDGNFKNTTWIGL